MGLLEFQKNIMVSAGVSWEGKNKHYFIDTYRPKVTSEYYIHLLDGNLFPGYRRFYPRNNYVYHQNGASSHKSRVTQTSLEEATQFSSRMMNGPHKVQNVTKWMTEHGIL